MSEQTQNLTFKNTLTMVLKIVDVIFIQQVQ